MLFCFPTILLNTPLNSRSSGENSKQNSKENDPQRPRVVKQGAGFMKKTFQTAFHLLLFILVLLELPYYTTGNFKKQAGVLPKSNFFLISKRFRLCPETGTGRKLSCPAAVTAGKTLAADTFFCIRNSVLSEIATSRIHIPEALRSTVLSP